MIARRHLTGWVKSTGFIFGVIDAFKLLNRREKINAVFLVLSMNINAVLGLVGLIGVLPFIQLMLQPDPLAGDGYIARALRLFHLTDVDRALVGIGLIVIALTVTKNIYMLMHARFQDRFRARFETRIAVDLLDRIVRAPYVWLVRRNSSVLRDIVIGQSIEVSRGVIRQALQATNDFLFLLGALGLIVVASPIVGIIVSVCALLVAGSFVAISYPRIAAHVELKRQAIRIFGVAASEAISGGRDIRMSSAAPMLMSEFARNMAIYSNADTHARQWQLVPRLGIEVVGFAALIGIALGALWLGTPRADVAALLVLYAVVAVRAVPLVTQLAASVSVLAGSLPAVNEIRTLMSELPQPEPHAVESNGSSPLIWQCLRFKNVTFTYAGSKAQAVSGLDLTIERGRSFGIVGVSGAGKSTLVDLIAGLLPSVEGEVLLDGVPLRGELLSQWRARIAYVAQTPFLLDASLADNIEFGQPAVADRATRLERVIAAAGLAELVRALPHGDETWVGEQGIQLSGGQRQRVAIARALYRNADILILDEATSSLDSLTERDVSEAIERLKGGLTLIIVAHRLSTVAHCDSIIVLEAGEIIGRGTHSELILANTTYRQMVEAQMFPLAVNSKYEN